MKLRTLLLTVLATILAACSRDSSAPSSAFVLEYQGIKIPTTKDYADVKAFKADEPHHLSPSALSSAAHAVKTAKFGPEFHHQGELDEAFTELQFPGYGSFVANQLGTNSSLELELMYVEIPGQGQNRYLAIARHANGSLRVVADFVALADPEIVRVQRSPSGQLEFLSNTGTVVRSQNAA